MRYTQNPLKRQSILLLVIMAGLVMMLMHTPAFSATLEGTGTEETGEGIANAAGSMWATVRGPMLGVIAFLVIAGIIIGATIGNFAGSTGGGALVGALSGISLGIIVMFLPSIVSTLYTTSGAASMPLSGSLVSWFSIDPTTTLATLFGFFGWRRLS